MSMRRKALISGLLLLLNTEMALAQIGTIAIEGPRPFGHFLGDVIALDIDIPAANGYELERASLPRTGQAAYWLDLVSINLDVERSKSINHWRIHLAYQNFYAALDARALVIPGFAVAFASAESRIEVNIPSWSFGVSPLREVRPTAIDPLDFLRPDAAPQTISPQGFERAAGGFAAASVALLLLVAFDRAWWPFRRPAARPFAAASRQIRRELRRGGDGKIYLKSLLAVHRSLDLTAGRRVLADDLPGFLADRPAYDEAAAEFRRFFSASRRAFFGDDAQGAVKDLPPSALIGFCDRLAHLERGAR
jgi:mxaA protein